MTAALATGRPISAMVRAPCIDVSSSAVAKTIKGSLNFSFSKGFILSKTIGKKPFMSVIPSPYILPSDSVALKGSNFHSFSSNGTVSV